MEVKTKKKPKYPNLVAEMARNGDNRIDIAKLLGIIPNAVGEKLAGRLNWTQPQIDKLCEYYNKTYEELFK